MYDSKDALRGKIGEELFDSTLCELLFGSAPDEDRRDLKREGDYIVDKKLIEVKSNFQ